MKKIKKTIAACSLVFSVLLCGCGAGGASEVIMIGQAGDVSSAEEGEASSGNPEGEAGGILDAGSEAAGQKTAEPEIFVYVCGAVAKPGVVTLPGGSRAEDALNAAGGFAENASRDYVNLAQWVNDGEKLYFPTLEEADSLPSRQETDDGLVNINTADVETLCTLSGIGESRAKDIIAYREANGAFESCEDIMKVPGIKTSVYNKISDRIKVR